MKRVRVAAFSMVIASASFAAPLSAQENSSPAASAAAPVEVQQPIEPAPVVSGAASRFVRDVASDYKHFFSPSTARWLGTGGSAALAIHAADEAFVDKTQQADGGSTNLPGAQEYGSLAVQVPLAIGWWVVGHAANSERESAAGRDLLRAQISAVSWTYALKYSFDRTRPNGDPRSFPSGHTSAAFATAIVMQQHYGWKVGTPAFALATYTGVARVGGNKHWASDVVFGAFLGMTSGRTVTVRLRGVNARIEPLAVPGGGGIVVNAAR